MLGGIVKLALILSVGMCSSFFCFAQRTNPLQSKEAFHLVTIHNKKIDSLVRHYRHKAENYLIKGKYLHNIYSIDSIGIKIFATSYHKKQNKPEFSLTWEEVEIFDKLIRYADKSFVYDIYLNKRDNPLSPMVSGVVSILEQNHPKPLGHLENKPLQGFRIAIDPGHTAGDFAMARIEQRYIKIFHEKKWYEFAEGILTLATARILKDSLEKYGATVLLTRTKHGHNSDGQTYQEWLKYRLPQILRNQGLNEKQIADKIKNTPKEFFFEYYSNEDLENRAQKINLFKPHFSIILHYNIDGDNKSCIKPTEKNYSMTFVPGAYMVGELHSAKDRFDFLRTLLTNHFEESVILSSFVQEAFVKQLNVPAVTEADNPFYLRNSCLKVKEGIYARNLRLCRLLNSPLCYGEPLLQDNVCELQLLALHNEKKGIISPRVVEVANAYLTGILKYAAYWKKKAS